MELNDAGAPRVRPPTFPVAPGLGAFACLLGLYLWGGSCRVVTDAATWWADGQARVEEETHRLALATALLTGGVLLAVLGVILGFRSSDPRLRRAAVGFHLVILLAAALAVLLGHWEARWADAGGIEP